MFKIVALNDDDLDDASEQELVIATREAQEAIAENEYIRAIRLKAEGKDEISLHILSELLKTQVLNECNTDDKLWFIKYNCHKNIAIILEERGEYTMALQNYVSAILIDNTDVYTLHKFGQLALKRNSIDLAEYAFENCLLNNPLHWRAAYGMLISFCHNNNIVGIYNSAVQICRQDPSDKIAVQMIHDIMKWFRNTLTFLKLCGGTISDGIAQLGDKFVFEILFNSRESDVKNECNSKLNLHTNNLLIGSLTWHSVGQFIVDFHSHINDCELFDFNFKDVISVDSVDYSGDHIKTDYQSVRSTQDEPENSNLSNDIELNQTKTYSTEKCETQPVDYNNDDSDSNTKSDGCDSTKNKPRRRCSDLNFLEQWGWHKNRRYSSRKKAEKEEIDDSLNCYLRRIFSKYMLTSVEGKWPFNGSAVEGSRISNGQCFNCQRSRSEELFHRETHCKFESFLTKLQANKIDIMVLIFQWLKHVSLFWNMPMPDEIKQLYVEIFVLYISHFDLSSWNQLSLNNCVASFRMCTFFLELTINKKLFHTNDTWQQIFQHLKFNMGICKTISPNKSDLFELRLVYMEYLLFSEQSKYNDCLMCLDQMALMLGKQSESFVLHLPNLGNVCININSIEKIQAQYRSQIDINSIPKLYESELWPQLTDIIINNIESSNDNYENENWFKDFRTIVQILLQSFWKMGSYECCLVWSEKCLQYAVLHYMEETKSTHRQKLLADFINFITSHIEAVILSEGYRIVAHLNGDTLSRMVQNIIRILVYQFDGTFEKNSTHGVELDFKRPWVILHQLVLREEDNSRNITDSKSNNIEDLSESVPNSFMILFTAHEYLGRRQWCSNDNGEFLQYILDAVILNFKAPIYDICRDVIYEYIEQVTYCLFKYPQKKARSKHLEDHEAFPVKLVWPKAVQIFDLYQPEHLPEFNSYKLESITADMEQMLLKIISLIPKELDPSDSTHNVIRYIKGHSNSHPEQTCECTIPYKIINLYYLLADFYFKTRDFMKAIKFYTLDISVNPTRFDSWAGMALSKASLIETKLNGLDQISKEVLWEECEQVIRCFESCITLNKFQTLLWIEYGSFCYTIHSYFTRYVKYNAELPTDIFSSIQQRKDKLLNIAHNCFSVTSSLQNSTPSITEDITDANDEKWLCQYMLGKISEKRKEEPKLYLNHYLMAANYLYESNATYPIKINHSNPTSLSVEALEVFYRINASIIKHITFSKTVSRNNGDLFSRVLINLSNSPFAFNKAKIDGNSLNILKKSIGNKLVISSSGTSTQPGASYSEETKTTENVSSQARSQSPSTNSSSSSVSTESSSIDSESDSDLNPNDGNNSPKCDSPYTLDELKHIYRMVVQNIEECSTRFPEHYKSLYRLIYHFMNSPPEYCDLGVCEQLLIGQYKTTLGNVVNGLFYERKNNNLFNGIWRIPSSEIDRPGSFSTHLVKCVKMFILFLSKTNNHKILIDIALNLYKTPDVDKRYIADAARKDLYQQCITYAVRILRDVLQRNLNVRDDIEILNLLTDIYKIHKKCVKYMNQKEATFTKLLVEVYKFFVKDKLEQVPDNCNYLDLAIKLCLQEVTLRKTMEKPNYIDSPTNLPEYFTAEPHSMIARPFNIPGGNIHPKCRTDMSKAEIVDVSPSEKYISASHALTETNSLPSTQFMDITPPFSDDNQLLRNVSKDIQHSQEYCNTILEREKCSSITLNMNELEVANSFVPKTIRNVSLLPNLYDMQQQQVKIPTKNKKDNFKPYHRFGLNDHISYVNKKSESSDYNDTHNMARYKDFLPVQCNLPKKSLPIISYSDNNLEHITIMKQNMAMLRTSSTPSILENKAEYSASTLYPVKSHCTAEVSSSSSHINMHVNADCSPIPTKTLQQKLAERQKSNQLNEINLLSVAPVAPSKTCEDIIILD